MIVIKNEKRGPKEPLNGTAEGRDGLFTGLRPHLLFAIDGQVEDVSPFTGRE